MKHQQTNQRSRLGGARGIRIHIIVGALAASACTLSTFAAGPTILFGPPVFVDQSLDVGRFAVTDFNLDNETDVAVIDLNLNIWTITSGTGADLVDSLAALGGQPFDPRIDVADLNTTTCPTSSQ